MPKDVTLRMSNQKPTFRGNNLFFRRAKNEKLDQNISWTGLRMMIVLVKSE